MGNDAAEAADFGRRRVSPAVIDARRNFSAVCGRWYPIVLDLHRFFIAISRAVVNHDGGPGTAPDPLVWSAGALPKRRRLVHAVRDRAFLPRPLGIWHSEWFQLPAAVICAEDIALWPFTPGLLVKWVHWPVGDLDLGVGGVSYVELLILYELWAGERLSLEKAHPRYLRPRRPISVSAVPFGPGIDIWRSCRFVGALMRSLCLLPGGLRRFVPCSIGANHCRLKSGRALLTGTLPLRYCASRFASSTPTWRLRASGHVARLVAVHCEDAGDRGDEVLGLGVHRVSGSGPVRKRFRLNKKTPAHLVRLFGRDCVLLVFSSISMLDHTRRRCDHAYGETVLAHDKVGVG